jgi:DNA-binding YbaB/EbfC family protein
MKNMNQLMRQAKKLQDEMMKAQAALAEREVEGTAGGGAVKIKMNGHKQVLGVEIAKEVVDPEDVEMLQDLVLAAIQDAMNQVDEIASAEMGKYTRGLNLPGLF